VNAATLKEPEEIALAMQVVVLRDKLEPYFAEGRYQEALVELAELRDVIDAFFEKVMVNVEDKELRINRLSMLENCASCSCAWRIFRCCSKRCDK
jgi:glycyl-tRNA synthetase beta chain